LISLGFGNRSGGSRTFVDKNAKPSLASPETLGNGAARIASGVSEGEAPIALCQAISDQKNCMSANRGRPEVPGARSKRRCSKELFQHYPLKNGHRSRHGVRLKFYEPCGQRFEKMDAIRSLRRRASRAPGGSTVGTGSRWVVDASPGGNSRTLHRCENINLPGTSISAFRIEPLPDSVMNSVLLSAPPNAMFVV
jgi:hypothetical protein